MLKREARHCHCIISWQRTLWKNKEVECVFFLTVENNRTRWGVNNNLFQDLPAGKFRGDSILPPSDLRCLIMRLHLPRRSTFGALWAGRDTVYLQQCGVWTVLSRQCCKCTQRFAMEQSLCLVYAVCLHNSMKKYLISLEKSKQEGRWREMIRIMGRSWQS